MCNIGVRASTYDNIVVLDSDRILPHGYFTHCTGILEEGTVITTKPLYNLEKPYTDEEIETGNISKKPDFRSENNQPRKKNLFAGNTIIKKKDYWRCGGMDESFIGYGFSDTDMTQSAKAAGLMPLFLNETELHLYHEKCISWKGQQIPHSQFKIISAKNALRYLQKWKQDPDMSIIRLFREIVNNKQEFSEEEYDEFLTLLRASNAQIQML